MAQFTVQAQVKPTARDIHFRCPCLHVKGWTRKEGPDHQSESLVSAGHPNRIPVIFFRYTWLHSDTYIRCFYVGCWLMDSRGTCMYITKTLHCRLTSQTLMLIYNNLGLDLLTFTVCQYMIFRYYTLYLNIDTSEYKFQFKKLVSIFGTWTSGKFLVLEYELYNLL